MVKFVDQVLVIAFCSISSESHIETPPVLRKTTTLLAALAYINKPGSKIWAAIDRKMLLFTMIFP